MDTQNRTGQNNTFIVPHWYMYPPKGLYRPVDDLIPRIENEFEDLCGDINIYLHIPFCNMKCSFCTLFTSLEKSELLIDDYIKYLIKEIDIVSNSLRLDKIQVANLYFGGGTPSVLPIGAVEKVLSHLRSKFSFSDSCSMSVEFSPESSSKSTSNDWKSMGFNRVSIGIQSFDREFLKSMNREQTYDRCQEALSELADARFTEINVDLIYGHQKQSIQHLASDIDTAIAHGANSISIHPLAYRRRTGYTINDIKQQGFKYELEHYEYLYEGAINHFESKGWRMTSAVSFSGDNKGQRLEEAEANGIPTIGFGAGARSYLPSVHTSSIQYYAREVFKNALSGYFNHLDNERLPIASYYLLDEEDRIRRRLVLSMVGRGLSERFINDIRIMPLNKRIVESLEKLEGLGLVKRANGEYCLTNKGRINAALVGAFLSGEKVQKTIGYK